MTAAQAPGSGAPSRARRWGAVLAWLLAMAVGAAVIARGHYTADLSAFLPASPDARQQMLIEQLQGGVAARTLMLAIDGGDATAASAKSRTDASRALAARLRASGLFEQVHNGDTDEWKGGQDAAEGASSSDKVAGGAGSADKVAGGAGEWLVAHRFQLSPAIDAAHFTPEGLRSAIDDTLSLLGTPAGALVKPLLERDPVGDTQRIVEAMIPAEAPRSQNGVWVSRERPRALLLLQTGAPGGDLDAQAAALARIAAEWSAVAKASPGLTLKVSGTPRFSVDSRARIEAEIRFLAIAGTLLMGALLLLAFGTPQALVVAFLPVATGVVAGICAVSLGFGTVHGITLGFGSTLIGEAVDYAIYFLIQARGAVQRGQAPAGGGWRAWLAQSWPTVRLGLLTSVCGFSALVFSGFPGLAQLGVFSLAGLLAAALATRWVLPALMPDGAAGAGLRRWLGHGTAWAVARLPALRWPMLAAGALVLGVLLVQRGDLWHGDLGGLSPVPRAELDLDAELRAELLAGDARTMVAVQGADADAALAAAEAAGRALDALVADGRLAGYDSPARFLPSQAVQRARLAALPDAATLRPRLAQALDGAPLKAGRLEPFVAEVDAARRAAPLQLADLAGHPLKAAVDAMLMRRTAGPGWIALLSLQPGARPIEPAAQRALLEQTLRGVPGAQVVDIKHELDGLYERYLREALWQSLLGAAGVVALLAFTLRDVRRVLAVCRPLVLAVLLTLGLQVAAGVPLGILHLIGILLVVAVGSNYALFFDRFGQLQRGGVATDEDTLASLLLANVTTVGSFALIAASSIPALAAIGRIVAPGALLALVLSAVFAPRTAARPVPAPG